MKASTLRTWIWVHKWSSIVGSALLLLLCVTGLPLIFHEEIEHATEPPPRATGERVASNAGARSPTLGDFAAHALAEGRGAHLNFVLLERGEPYVRVGTSDTLNPGRDEGYTHWYDRVSGDVLEPPPPHDGGFIDVMLHLHTDLYVGLPGTLLIGSMGLLLAVALVSGVVLYAPFMRRLEFGTVRHESSPRARWLDIHNLLGIVTLVWLFVVGITGTISALEVPLGQLWRNNGLLPMIRQHAGGEATESQAPLESVLRAVHDNAPGTEPASIIYPGMTISGPGHFLVIVHGDPPATSRIVRAILVDAASARVVSQAVMPWYVQALSFSQPLHFGDYGGLPMKILWALLDVLAIIVLGSGLYLWVGRSRAH